MIRMPRRFGLTARGYRRAMVAATAAALGLGVAAWVIAVPVYLAQVQFFGRDLAIMRELGRRWLDTGTMYLPFQLAGPYSVGLTPNIADNPGLYPPAAAPLFAALSLVPLPVAVLAWWAIPALVIVVTIARWRPRPWTWPLIALCVAYPWTAMAVYAGNTALWATAFVALGLVWGWPSALVLLKPTLLPFALVGIRHRSWWVAVLLLGALTLLGPWRDYVSVARNAIEGNVLYSANVYPLLAIPVIAWLGRWRPEPPPVSDDAAAAGSDDVLGQLRLDDRPANGGNGRVRLG
jgi:hypothetical protein